VTPGATGDHPARAEGLGARWVLAAADRQEPDESAPSPQRVAEIRRDDAASPDLRLRRRPSSVMRQRRDLLALVDHLVQQLHDAAGAVESLAADNARLRDQAEGAQRQSHTDLGMAMEYREQREKALAFLRQAWDKLTAVEIERDQLAEQLAAATARADSAEQYLDSIISG
jgi:hypothetical protein